MGLFARIGQGTKNLAMKPVKAARRWSDYDRMEETTHFMVDRLKQLFLGHRGPVMREDFQEAMARHGLSHADTEVLKTRFKMAAYMFVLAGLGIFGFGIYHLMSWSLKAVLICIGVSSLSFAFAFRYHFWAFQISQRRLGCTMKEWFHRGLLGKSS